MKRTTGFYQGVKEHLIKLQRLVTYVFNKGFFSSTDSSAVQIPM